MQKKRDVITTVVFGIIFLAGLSVMLYPSFSNWWNQRHQTRAVASYKEAVAEMDDGETERIWDEARAYNARLAGLYAPFSNFEQIEGYDDIKSGMTDYTLLDERESEEPVPQRMQDYENIALFDSDCDLTLCFTDAGLIGFNYHDIARSRSYREWYGTLEGQYGMPTEEGSGMASWYDNPVGKNTAVYLFNLEEGVQVSFYATAATPDRSYEKQGDAVIPTPEIRTPIVPVTEDAQQPPAAELTAETTTAPPQTVPSGPAHSNLRGTLPTAPPQTDAAAAPEETGTAPAETTTTAAAPLQTEASAEPGEPRTEPETTVSTAAAELPLDRRRSFLLEGLEFYGAPAAERRKMSAYTQLYEYRTEEPGQPWELIMEYENVPYEGKSCDAVLCFTSLGLVGVNFFDSSRARYSDWAALLTEIYGAPDEVQQDYMAWGDSPVGAGTMIYVFALEDGVQISFFADDTGSEPA